MSHLIAALSNIRKLSFGSIAGYILIACVMEPIRQLVPAWVPRDVLLLAGAAAGGAVWMGLSRALGELIGGPIQLAVRIRQVARLRRNGFIPAASLRVLVEDIVRQHFAIKKEQAKERKKTAEGKRAEPRRRKK